MKQLTTREVVLVNGAYYGASYGTLLFTLIPIAGVTIKRLYCESNFIDSLLCDQIDQKPSLLSTISIITLSSALGMTTGALYDNPAVGITIGGVVGIVSAVHFKIETLT